MLQFWFEFASTYSYLSVSRIEKTAAQLGVSVVWKPLLLGPIFQEQGWKDSPFNLYPAKGKYMWRDLERRCEKYGLPFRKPSQFPRNGLHAARIACVLRDHPQQADFIRQVFRSNFVEDRDIGDVLLLQRIVQNLSLDSESILQKSNSEENKSYLQSQVAEAEDLGIFGAPTFVVGEEIFWGDDRLEDALIFARSRSRPLE